LRNYLHDASTVDNETTTYFARSVDLSGHGPKEAIVYLTGNGWCGSGGCTVLILATNKSSYRIVTKITITRPPIVLLDTKSRGWRDIGVFVEGGGVEKGYTARLRFDGHSYPNNPSVPPAKPIRGKLRGKVIVPIDAKGAALR
jgi:hypothetical protein